MTKKCPETDGRREVYQRSRCNCNDNDDNNNMLTVHYSLLYYAKNTSNSISKQSFKYDEYSLQKTQSHKNIINLFTRYFSEKK